MDVQIAALCDAAADYGGKLCLIGTFDTILARELPAVHAYCSLAVRVVFHTGEEGRHQYKIALIDEDGRNLLQNIEPTVDIRLQENTFFATSNLIFNLQGLRFERAGQYSIDITLDGKIVARIPLQVLLMKDKA